VTEEALASSLARRYRIVRKLGAGGMGSVFLAEQITLGNRQVALKVLSRKWLDDPEFLSRFHNEGISTARIQHPNVVTIYETGQADDGSPYIAMEYLKGEPLSEALKSRGALPVGECAEILLQAARGLNAAHKLGIIHRDLKPENLFLTRGDEGELIIKVVDFGIAKLRESPHTQTGMLWRTPAYMSFEQASGMRSDELDARSDIYSLGVVVYEMVAGRVPFTSDTQIGYLRKHLMEPPPPFRAVAPGLAVPAQVEAVVMKALAKDRNQRYGSVLDFARAFAEAAKPAPVAVGAVREPPLRDAGSTLPSTVVHPAPAARPPGVGARRPFDRLRAVSEVEPRLAPTEAGPGAASKKTPHVAIAGVIAAVAVVIVAALAWVYWRRPAQPPRSPAKETGVPAKPQTAVPAPSVNNPPTSPPSAQPKPAQIVVQTSPNAQVYLDETFKGQVGRKGRLLIDGPKPGDHVLRVSLPPGKKDYEQRVTVAAGEVATITATLADAEQPPPPTPVEAPRRVAPAPVALTVRENPKDGLKYVWIPPGTFTMGCSPSDSECYDDEKPAHQVTITRGFWIGQTPVTVGAYKGFARATARQMPLLAPNFNNGWTNENMPIVNVTWNDAQAYCGWMGGRLLTEAEWEYAARGGNTKARYGPIDEIAWYGNNSGGQTHDVGQKRPNGFGLHDMLGNVWQWVNDWYNERYYQSSPSQDPPGPTSGQYRVLRGGSWVSNPTGVRVSYRDRFNPAYRYVSNVFGFRCGGEVGNP
jgi:serine/threonine-protein kinase